MTTKSTTKPRSRSRSKSPSAPSAKRRRTSSTSKPTKVDRSKKFGTTYCVVNPSNIISNSRPLRKNRKDIDYKTGETKAIGVRRASVKKSEAAAKAAASKKARASSTPKKKTTKSKKTEEEKEEKESDAEEVEKEEPKKKSTKKRTEKKAKQTEEEEEEVSEEEEQTKSKKDKKSSKSSSKKSKKDEEESEDEPQPAAETKKPSTPTRSRAGKSSTTGSSSSVSNGLSEAVIKQIKRLGGVMTKQEPRQYKDKFDIPEALQEFADVQWPADTKFANSKYNMRGIEFVEFALPDEEEAMYSFFTQNEKPYIIADGDSLLVTKLDIKNPSNFDVYILRDENKDESEGPIKISEFLSLTEVDDSDE